jgi:hypothetical protein
MGLPVQLPPKLRDDVRAGSDPVRLPRRRYHLGCRGRCQNISEADAEIALRLAPVALGNLAHAQPLAAVSAVAKSNLAKLGSVRPVLKTHMKWNRQ